MGQIRDSKSLSAIQESIEGVIEDTDSTLDLTVGTAVKDVVVDAPATQVRALAVLTDFVGASPSLQDLLDILADSDYLEDLQEALPEFTIDEIKDIISDQITGLASNYQITRNAAVPAQYKQRFYRADDNGGAALTIPVGTKVQNLDGSIKAEVQVSTAQVPQYDSSKGRYYVEETVIATEAGSSGNTALNSLTRFVASIPTLATETANVATLVEGQDEETDANLAVRAQDSFRGRNVNTDYGYANILKADPFAFTDANVVGPGDELMTRLGSGGIDIYVTGGEPTTVSERQIYSSSQTFYLLSFQPVDTILSVVGSISGTISPTAYQQETDTSDFARSAKGRTRLEVLNPSAFVNSEVLTITYTFDQLILAAQNHLESEDYNVPDASVLVKKATQVLINLTLEVVLDGSEDETTVQATIQSDLAIFLAGGTASDGAVHPSFRLGENIDKSDILSVLTRVAGVDRIDLDTFEVYTVRSGVATLSTSDPVAIDDNEYARAGTVTFL